MAGSEAGHCCQAAAAKLGVDPTKAITLISVAALGEPDLLVEVDAIGVLDWPTLLACCNMRTLYLRNVPDEVVERLQRLAERDGTSLGAVAVRELTDVSRRADNAALLGVLPDLDIATSRLLDDLEAVRAER